MNIMDELTISVSVSSAALHENDYIRTAVVSNSASSSYNSGEFRADFPPHNVADLLPDQVEDFSTDAVKTEAEEAVWYNLRKLGKEELCRK